MSNTLGYREQSLLLKKNQTSHTRAIFCFQEAALALDLFTSKLSTKPAAIPGSVDRRKIVQVVESETSNAV